MILRRLEIVNYKNIASAALDFGAGLNCFVGENGAGKTNVLDAIHFLSMCRSSLGTGDRANVRHGAEFFVLEGGYRDDRGRSLGVAASFSGGTNGAGGSGGGCKKVKCDGKEYERLSDHVGVVPIVMVSPADTFLVSDAADERRRWLNAFISQLDRPYLQALVRYNAVLAERNKLLKGGEQGYAVGEILDILDGQLVAHGEVIHALRAAIVERMRPLVAGYYARLADDREQVEMVYRSELNGRPFAEILADGRGRDLANGFTTGGVHRDDIVMRIGGHPLRRYGSQGQQKSFLVALKLAQFAVVRDVTGERPILLLDDLFDKLDTGRVERLIALVSDGLDAGTYAGVQAASDAGAVPMPATGGGSPQIFISDCNRTRLEAVLQRVGRQYSLFDISGGVCEGLTSQ